MIEPPLNPERTQWSDDGTRWWDGSAWIEPAAVPARQAELEREAEARLREEQAAYAQRYVEWQSQQAVAVADNPFATPGTAASAPPPPPPGMVLTPTVAVGPRPTGYATGMWSFVSGTAGFVLCGIGAIAAVVLGHVSRSQARKAGLRPNIWSRWGLFLGYVEVVLISGLVAVGIWALTNPAHTDVGVSLTNAAQAQRYYHDAYGTYARSTTELAPTRYRPQPGVTVSVESATADSFCLRGQRGASVYWLRSGGSVTKHSCR